MSGLCTFHSIRCLMRNGQYILEKLNFVNYLPKMGKVIPNLWYCALWSSWATECFSWRRPKSWPMYAISFTSQEGHPCRAVPLHFWYKLGFQRKHILTNETTWNGSLFQKRKSNTKRNNFDLTQTHSFRK